MWGLGLGQKLPRLELGLGHKHYVRDTYKKYRLTLCKLTQFSRREIKTNAYTKMITIVKTHHSRNVYVVHYHLQASDAHFGLIGAHQWSLCIINQSNYKRKLLQLRLGRGWCFFLTFPGLYVINNTFIRQPVAALALTAVLAVKSATAAQLVTG